MIERKPLPDRDYLLSRFSVENGRLVWKPKPSTTKEQKRWNSRYAGKIAGTVDKVGYSHVKIDSIVYLEHRVCFKMYHNYCPDVIDHDDGNKLNNIESNLLDSNCLLNNNNRHVAGLEGIYEKDGVFLWVVNYNQETFSVSGFKTKEEATIARAIAKQQILKGSYTKKEKKRRDNTSGLSCVFVATRERTFFFKFVFDKTTYCKYGFNDPERCAIALEKLRLKVMKEKYKPANKSFCEKHKEEIYAA